MWGYRSMSRYDVLRAIQHTKLLYSVDADCVYLTGVSAGATGAMHTAAQRPDLFAAVVPLVGWVWPAWMRIVYLGSAYAAFPIGMVVSFCLLVLYTTAC